MTAPDDDPVQQGSDAGGKLSPQMVSFRGLVLAFVVSYINTWGQSPSYGEIAAAMGSNRTRVKRALASLEKAGLLHRAAGTRGLSLPDEIARARQIMKRAGLLQGFWAEPVTNPTLLPPAALDYPARSDDGRDERDDGNAIDT